LIRRIFFARDASNKHAATKQENVMKGKNATLSLAFLALLSLIFCKPTFAQQPPDNVAGNWTIYSTNIDNGETVVKQVQIEQFGNRITGYFEGPNQSGPIQGEIDVHHIRFSTVTRNVLTFRGQIYGDSMSGLYGLHGRQAQWQAERMPPVAQAVPAATASYSQPVLVPSSPAPVAMAAPQPVAPSTTASATQGYSAPTPALLSQDQLDSLVAPIALYPDALVAQVLAAAANPDEVAYADDWLAQNKSLTGTALAQAVDQQSWDPSVKALTQFPSVLDNLAHNLSWTSSLGQAFANQQADVMAAVQGMRAKAQAAGTLQSNSQITVVQQSPSTIVIQPSNPQVVYVPQYNPAVVFGAPVAVPLYVAPPVPVAAAGVFFGGGISIGATFGGSGWGGGFGWGWHAWNVNWGGGWGGGDGGGTVIYNNNTYINKQTWNNTNYNGYHPWGPGNNGYHPGTDTHYGPNGAYHPNGYYGPNGAFHHDVPGTNPNNQPNGGHNGDHNLIGGNGGVEHVPDGGRNGDHGLIGGNGGVQNPNAGRNGPGVAPNGGYHDNNNRDNNRPGGERNEKARNAGRVNRSPMNGAASRAESNRGRASMGPRRPPQQHMAREHAPAEHHSSGGGHRR
jgi:Protein of unknown function (DUF3300)